MALHRLPFRDEHRVDRVADDGREQTVGADDEPVIVEVCESVEDLTLREHGERDLRSEDDRERRMLAPELPDPPTRERDQRGDRRRIQQCDGQLQREAQAEVERHRHGTGMRSTT